MSKPPTALRDWLKSQARHISRIHFYLVSAFCVYILLSDAWDLITPTVIWQRWIIALIMLTVSLAVWYFARQEKSRSLYYKHILYVLILLDLSFAVFAVYTGRGMASRAAILFTVPIAISAITLSRRTLFATTALAAAAYFLTALKYYDGHPNEGYLAELYIEVGLYSAIFFILTAVLWSLIHPKKTGIKRLL